MIRTKKAKKVLTKKEQRHLTESNIHTMAAMERQVAFLKTYEGNPTIYPCWECRAIARKLGLMD